MEDKDKVPLMLEFLFGKAAGAARQGASPRLLSWCQAVDEWLAERERTYKPGITKPAVLGWRRLLRHCRKIPWELRPADIEGHVAWMQTAGYSPNTIHADLGIMANFYHWCSERQIDYFSSRLRVGRIKKPALNLACENTGSDREPANNCF
jgi:hypothetical protein